MTSTAVATHAPTVWDIDPVHSSMGFAVRHLVISKVRGRFARWAGSLTLDDASPEQSHVELKIETDSIDTHEPQRDAHLRSADFFDAARYPAIEFRSTRIEKTGDDRYQVAGDLTISAVTRNVVLEVEALGQTRDPWGGQRAGFSAKTSIDRREFGLVWNQALETGGVVVGDKVEIAIEIEAIKRADPTVSAAA